MMPADVEARREQFRYCPYYCEENTWHLCREPRFAKQVTQVVFISNPGRTCALWGQRAAAGASEPVIWDYHVILAVNNGAWMIWDLDSVFDFPIQAREYLDKTFPRRHSPAKRLTPQFRLFDGSWYAEHFGSDRSHMIDEEGRWLAPPPVWPVIGPGQSNLRTLFDFHEGTQSRPLSLDEATAFFTSRK